MKRIFVTALLLLCLAAPAAAIELDQAKQEGKIGETPTGYIAAVSAPSADVQKLISRINDERRERYQDIAKKNNTSLSAVEALAGKKAIDMTPGGQYVQSAGGQWVRK